MIYKTIFNKNLLFTLTKSVIVVGIGWLGISACNPTVEQASPPTRSFSTIDLLIRLSDMPPTWSVVAGPQKLTGDTYYYSRDASRIVFETEFKNSPKRSGQGVYQFTNSRNAEQMYNDFFLGSPGEEPTGWSYQSMVADQYDFVCYDYEGRFPPICTWVGRYEEYVVEFTAWLIPNRMSLSDIEHVIKTIDSIMEMKLKLLVLPSFTHPARKNGMLDDVGDPARTYNTVAMGKRKVFRTIVLFGLGIITSFGCQTSNPIISIC